MACGSYTNSCATSGYYSDSVAPFIYQNSGCYGYTGSSECGPYYVDHSGCYVNVIFSNWPDFDDTHTDWCNDHTHYVWQDNCWDHTHTLWDEWPDCDGCHEDVGGSCDPPWADAWDNHECSWGNFCDYDGGYKYGCNIFTNFGDAYEYTDAGWCDGYSNGNYSYIDASWCDDYTDTNLGWNDFYNVPFNNFCNHNDTYN